MTASSFNPFLVCFYAHGLGKAVVLSCIFMRIKRNIRGK